MSLIKITNRFADRGGVAEKAVQNFLTEWAQQPYREFSRLVDSKAAGRTIKAAAADFEFYHLRHGDKDWGADGRSYSTPTHPYYGLIEVKETQHDFRLEKKRVTQLARLRKRSNCGGTCLVLVFHSAIGKWRCIDVPYMTASGTLTGSWDLRDRPAYSSAGNALAGECSEVFG